MSSYKKLIIALAILIVLTPLGLITQNPSWGEWSEEEMSTMIGFVPKGIKEGSFFEAPFGDYSFMPFGEIGGYIFSALIGSIIIISIFYALKKLSCAKK
jgi:hypothetical protein